MNLASILVMTSGPNFNTTIKTLNEIRGLEVHYHDQSSGRIIVTQEAENTSEAIAGLKRIKSLPYVVMAEMVYHYCGHEAE